jgi:hypothetical protein
MGTLRQRLSSSQKQYIAVATGVGLVCGWLAETFSPPPPWMWNPGAIFGVLLGGVVFGGLGYLIVCRGYFAKS